MPKQCPTCNAIVCPVCGKADCVHPDTCDLHVRVAELEREVAKLKTGQVIFGPILSDDVRESFVAENARKMLDEALKQNAEATNKLTEFVRLGPFDLDHVG